MSYVNPGRHGVALSLRARLAVTVLTTGALLLGTPAVSSASFPNRVSPNSSINGGTVGNGTNLPVNANGGLSASNASGGNDNLALNGDGDRDDRDHFHRWDHDDWRHDNRDDRPQVTLAGNGGVAGSSANGGLVGIGNVNSGGNAGYGVAVGHP